MLWGLWPIRTLIMSLDNFKSDLHIKTRLRRTPRALPLYWWLHKNLDEGCLEDRLKKVSSLVALIGAEWLATHPDSAGEAAYAIGCNGRDHKVVDER